MANDKEKILQDVGYAKKIKKKEIVEEPDPLKKNSCYDWGDKKKRWKKK